LNIILDKKSVTDGLIKVSVTESDYLPKVEEKVKDYARKANIKGFRAGKVPSGVIRKMFGKSILVEEVNHLISHSLSDYIRDNKLRVLGEPLPNQEKARLIDWDVQKEFEFEFQIGMVDEFKVELSNKIKVQSHPITVDQQVIDETMEDVRRKFGKVTYPDVSGEEDNLFGEVTTETGEKRSSYIQIGKLEGAQKKKFIGLKKDDEAEFDVAKLSKDPQVIVRAINVSEEEAGKATGKFTLKVSTISRMEPATLDQELFDKVFGKDVVTSEEQFVGKIRETISENYQRETTHLLDHEIQHYFVDHTSISMPEEFLKSWLKASSEGKVTDEVIDKEFKDYCNSLKWDLVKNRIAEEHKIEVTEEEIKDKAKRVITEQFGGEALIAQLGDKMDSIAMNYLAGQDGKGENYMRIHTQLRTEKIMKVIREHITVAEKPVSLDEFKKLAAAHQH